MTHLHLHNIDLSARLLIILHMARYSQTFIFSLFSYLSKVQNKTALDSFNSSIIKTNDTDMLRNIVLFCEQRCLFFLNHEGL